LSQRTFTIFVVMALVTTFATTPLVSYLYPPWYQKKLEAWKRGEIDWDTGAPSHADGSVDGAVKPTDQRVGRLLVYLRLDNMPALLSLVSLFGVSTDSSASSDSGKEEASASSDKGSTTVAVSDHHRAVRAHGLRLIQLSDRDSSVMTVSEVEQYSRNDTVLNIFRTVGQFLKVAVSGEVAVLPEARFGEALLTKSSDIHADLLLLPWSEAGRLVESSTNANEGKISTYAQFAKSVVASSNHNIAIFFPNGSQTQPGADESRERSKLMRTYSFSDIHHDISPIPVVNQSHNIFMPFFGGSDDRYALTLVLQLCEKNSATATVVHYVPKEPATNDEADYFGYVSTHVSAAVAGRIEFRTEVADNAMAAALEQASEGARADSRQTVWHNLVVVGRRSNFGTDKTAAAGSSLPRAADDVQECLGYAAGTLIASKAKVNLLVVQAKTAQ
jgi:hypothetical protein